MLFRRLRARGLIRRLKMCIFLRCWGKWRRGRWRWRRHWDGGKIIDRRGLRGLWLNRQIDLRRMRKGEFEGTQGGELEKIELGWLYEPNFKEDVESWVAECRLCCRLISSLL
jgi:hypothetical protein